MPRKFVKKDKNLADPSLVQNTDTQTRKLGSLFKKIGIYSLIVFLFLSASSLLVIVPLAISRVQNKVILAGDQLQLTSENAQVVATPKPVQVTKIVAANKPAPKFASSAVFAQDVETGQILFQQNSNEELEIASTTKIMTALVSSEHFKSADVLTVPSEALVGGSSMGLSSGEQLSFRSLLYGMMLNSGNDAAYAIAANYPGGVEGFVVAMNQKAQALGLENSHFQNPAGFDNPNHYSTAKDLAKIATAAANNPQIAKVVGTKETFVYSWDKSKTHSLKNLNQLLSETGVVGMKTGTTDEAGPSLVGLVERNGHKVVTVVLNSPNRFSETKNLMDWIFENYTWTKEIAYK